MPKGEYKSPVQKNPFYVLELGTNPSLRDISRQKEKLLSMLELGLSAAQSYSTPLGNFERSVDTVRQAASTLSDPTHRVGWDLWALQENSDDSLAGFLAPALSDHYCAHGRLKNQELGAEEIDLLSAQWDELVMGELAHLVSARCRDLEVDGQRVYDNFVAQVRAELFLLLRLSPDIDLDELNAELVSEAANDLCQENAELLESMATAFLARGSSFRDERQNAWFDLKSIYRDLTGKRGAYHQLVCFDAVYDPVSDLALEAYEEEEYIFAESLFSWVSEQAKSVGNEDIYANMSHNARISGEAIAKDVTPTEEFEAENGRNYWWAAGLVIFLLFRLIRAGDCSSEKQEFGTSPISPDIQEVLMRNNDEMLERINRSVLEEYYPEGNLEQEPPFELAPSSTESATAPPSP